MNMKITEIIGDDIIRLEDGNPYVVSDCLGDQCLVNLDTGETLINKETYEVYLIMDILHDDMERPTEIVFTTNVNDLRK